MRLPLLLPLALFTLPLTAAAQPVRVTLVNGTTQVGASVDLVTLYRLGQGMEPVDSVENPAEQVTLEAPDQDSAGELPPLAASAPSSSRPATGGSTTTPRCG